MDWGGIGRDVRRENGGVESRRSFRRKDGTGAAVNGGWPGRSGPRREEDGRGRGEGLDRRQTARSSWEFLCSHGADKYSEGFASTQGGAIRSGGERVPG